MAVAETCPKCGAPLPSDALQGLCPLCLGKVVFGDGAAAPAVLPVSEKAGDRIGHYRLLQQIGEGGCGVVYMAEQEEPVRRRVAFKIIKLGMDTRQVIARFEAERQALALMDHPNIARVFDGGATSTGRPYFVMELVRGTKITDYCDQHNLSATDRIHLFIQVCHAIQHAHQKGIIHRDIKPSNVLGQRVGCLISAPPLLFQALHHNPVQIAPHLVDQLGRLGLTAFGHRRLLGRPQAAQPSRGPRRLRFPDDPAHFVQAG